MSALTGSVPRAMRHVLVLAPDDGARRTLHLVLDRGGHQVAAVTELDAALAYLGAGSPCEVVLAAPAFALALIAAGVAPAVIAVVRDRAIDEAIRLLDAGVDDVLAEPIDELAVALVLRHATARPVRASAAATPALLGDSEAMAGLRDAIARVAGTRSTVLIEGESGTGKELVARAIHAGSPRRERRFVAVNCAAIPEALLESELFGHRRGAFTDAVRDRAGLFEAADGGTLFLDEIGELSPALQAKLLRVLADGELRRVGDTEALRVDVRVLAATLRNLAAEVAAGRFREDLYHRLHVLAIAVPPLRDRSEDIPGLARWFAARHAQRHALGEVVLADDAVAVLAEQPWPGNVRELENAIERVVVLADRAAPDAPADIDAAALREVLGLPPAAAPTADEPPAAGGPLSLKQATRVLEERLLRQALEQAQGNRTNAAKLLEISQRALLYKIKEYGIR